MLIPAVKLIHYLPTLTFPVSLRDASGQLIRLVEKVELQILIRSNSIVGIGSPTRLRYIRFCSLRRTEQQLRRLGYQPHRVPLRAACNRTFELQALSPHKVWRHHPEHCSAFRPEGNFTKLDPSAL
ncbi:MAG: hypothetical protein ABFD89_16885 [Bryobacteraceae bacterium]